MVDQLGPLYHWSPRVRRKSIERLGLVPGKRNITGPIYQWNSNSEPDPAAGEFTQSGVCLATNPRSAWNLSHSIWEVPGTYDLWQLYPVDDDHVEVLDQWGATIREVRIHNRIKKSRLFWVGERTIDEKPREGQEGTSGDPEEAA